MRRLLFFALFSATFLLAYVITDSARPRDAYQAVCALSAKHFYKDSPAVRAWLSDCFEAARRLPRATSRDQVVALLQDRMDRLGVSHFSVFAPAEDKKLWTGEAVHTGIKSRYVDGHLMIYRVIEHSAAARARLRPGDEVVRLPGVDEVSPAGAAVRAGDFEIRRTAGTFTVTLMPTPLITDGAPRIADLGGGVKLFTIPSFRAEYFRGGPFKKMTRDLAQAKGIVIDIRENPGGNFAAMLRALSFFDCGGRTIGHLRQERNFAGEVGTLINDLNDGAQIRQLEHARELALTTPVGYGCFSGPIVALIASETSSVAEIFADALTERASTRVWGWPTAGDVVLAIWYPLPSLGPEYSVSIPQASFINRRGRDLEGDGVRPQRDLFYDLAQSRRGEDSWINEARRALRSH